MRCHEASAGGPRHEPTIRTVLGWDRGTSPDASRSGHAGPRVHPRRYREGHDRTRVCGDGRLHPTRRATCSEPSSPRCSTTPLGPPSSQLSSLISFSPRCRSRSNSCGQFDPDGSSARAAWFTVTATWRCSRRRCSIPTDDSRHCDRYRQGYRPRSCSNFGLSRPQGPFRPVGR